MITFHGLHSANEPGKQKKRVLQSSRLAQGWPGFKKAKQR
jgi:hypothetical protein